MAHEQACRVQEKDSYIDLFVLRQECGAAFV